MSKVYDRYVRRDNHLYLIGAQRKVKDGQVRFSNHLFCVQKHTDVFSGSEYLCYDRGVLRCVRHDRLIKFFRVRRIKPACNIPIWDFNTWVPVLKQKRKTKS